jgi:hypothetical protein
MCVRLYRAANADVDIGSPCTLASAHTCADAQLEQLISDAAQLLSHLRTIPEELFEVLLLSTAVS